MMDKIKAECTWGDGPDVSLSLNGATMVLLDSPTDLDKWVHGTVGKGVVSLTKEEARHLAFNLQMAADAAQALENMSKDMDESPFS